MSRVTKEASKDAAEWARSQMEYGIGAGTHRNHVLTAVNYKMDKIPGYEAAFKKAYENQDMLKHIKGAKRARRTADISTATSKNVRALARGDRNGLGPFVAAAVITVTVAHATGYDKKVIAYTKRKSGDVRAWLKRNL